MIMNMQPYLVEALARPLHGRRLGGRRRQADAGRAGRAARGRAALGVGPQRGGVLVVSHVQLPLRALALVLDLALHGALSLHVLAFRVVVHQKRGDGQLVRVVPVLQLLCRVSEVEAQLQLLSVPAELGYVVVRSVLLAVPVLRPLH